MKFRTDINGLRSYAVLAVIIFHFNHQWLPGGFAGVDVFFVIFGYLMTSIIFRGLENNKLSILKFYIARIKRIVPALLALIIILMIFGYLFLSPNLYTTLAVHARGSLLFFSNIIYWNEINYFNPNSISKYLLHTWSLSVEWQFYILFPLIVLSLSQRFSTKRLKQILAISTLLSFITTIYISIYWSNASYFSLPTRIWEILLGSLAYLYPLIINKQSNKNKLELLGLILIFSSFILITENSLWPGYATLLPTIGAFLIIQSHNSKSLFTNNFISQKLGLWSYSLYLWHWPLLVIFNYFNYQSSFLVYIICTMIFGLSSYYLIEKHKTNTYLVIMSTLIVLVFTSYVLNTNGYKQRVLFNSTEHDANYINIRNQYDINHKENYDSKYLMIGDSHAAHYTPYMSENKIDTLFLYSNGCLQLSIPLFSFPESPKEKCVQTNEKISNILTTNHRHIIWAQYWDAYEEHINLLDQAINKEAYYKKIIAKSIKSLAERNSSIKIYLIGQVVLPTYNIPECIDSRQLIGSKLISKSCPEWQKEVQPKYNRILKEIANEYKNAHFINPNEPICYKNRCKIIVNHLPLFRDDNHLSITGSFIIGEFIFNKIKEIEDTHH